MPITIQIDSREKKHAIGKIIRYFDENHILHFTSKLPVGDYINLDNARLAIDRKQNLSELASNVCQQHKRFKAELQRAKEYGIQLIVLCEHGASIQTLEDVKHWVNPRLRFAPQAITGEKLYKILHTMSIRHNVKFLFCHKADTGRRIAEILGGTNEPG